MSLTVKVFYERASGQSEIRRFSVNTTPGVDCFVATRDKIKQLYSSLANGNFTLYWQDPDGDRVAFSSNEEMRDAMTYVSDGVLRVYIPEAMEQGDAGANGDQKQQQPSEGQERQSTGGQGQGQKPVHIGVTCDGCEGPVIGIRYKCCVCPDYDLCEACEGKGKHTEHDMYKITQPRVSPMSFLPPHVGRYIQRCMKNMAQGSSSATASGTSASAGASANASTGASANASTGASAEASADAGKKDEKENKERPSYDDFLNSVGANIAAFLDPFGIDVTYDVHHGRGGRHRGGCRRGWGRRGGCPAWEHMSRQSQQEGDAPQGQEKPDTQETQENANPEMETDAGDKTPKQDEKGNSDEPMEPSNKAGSDSSSDEWTYLQEDGTEVRPASGSPIPMPGPSAIPMPGPSPTPQPATGPTPPPRSTTDPQTNTDPSPSTPNNLNTGDSQTNIYPNLRIQQSLDQMLAMGFANADGWLTALLTEHDGDIGATLDAIKAKATQQLHNLPGNH